MQSIKALRNKFRECKSTSIPLSIYFFGPRVNPHYPRFPISKMAPGLQENFVERSDSAVRTQKSRVSFAEYSQKCKNAQKTDRSIQATGGPPISSPASGPPLCWSAQGQGRPVVPPVGAPIPVPARWAQGKGLLCQGVVAVQWAHALSASRTVPAWPLHLPGEVLPLLLVMVSSPFSLLLPLFPSFLSLVLLLPCGTVRVLVSCDCHNKLSQPW